MMREVPLGVKKLAEEIERSNERGSLGNPAFQLVMNCWPWNFYELTWPIRDEIDAIISKAN